MVVSHAAALLRTHGASISIATAGVSIVSAFSTLGRVLGGWACDRPRIGAATVLRGAPALAAPALAWAAAAGNSVVAAQTALAAASFAYGVLASAVPVEVRRRVGRRDFRRVRFRVHGVGVGGACGARVGRGALRRARIVHSRADGGDGVEPGIRGGGGDAETGSVARRVGGGHRGGEGKGRRGGRGRRREDVVERRRSDERIEVRTRRAGGRVRREMDAFRERNPRGGSTTRLRGSVILVLQ